MSVKFHQFQIVCVWRQAKQLPATDRRSDCCIMYSFIFRKSHITATLNSKQNFSDAKNELGSFLPPTAIRRLSKSGFNVRLAHILIHYVPPNPNEIFVGTWPPIVYNAPWYRAHSSVIGSTLGLLHTAQQTQITTQSTKNEPFLSKNVYNFLRQNTLLSTDTNFGNHSQFPGKEGTRLFSV